MRHGECRLHMSTVDTQQERECLWGGAGCITNETTHTVTFGFVLCLQSVGWMRDCCGQLQFSSGGCLCSLLPLQLAEN
jgi:hypothetical protein